MNSLAAVVMAIRPERLDTPINNSTITGIILIIIGLMMIYINLKILIKIVKKLKED